HQDLLEYKKRTSYDNLLIPPDVPKRILEKEDPASVYSLVANDALFEPEGFGTRYSLSSRSTWTDSTSPTRSAGTQRTWSSTN
ncbi:MAG: hypothetical protein ACR2GU_16460, partial [Rubrobacteraceae bacterium]